MTPPPPAPRHHRCHVHVFERGIHRRIQQVSRHRAQVGRVEEFSAGRVRTQACHGSRSGVQWHNRGTEQGRHDGRTASGAALIGMGTYSSTMLVAPACSRRQNAVLVRALRVHMRCHTAHVPQSRLLGAQFRGTIRRHWQSAIVTRVTSVPGVILRRATPGTPLCGRLTHISSRVGDENRLGGRLVNWLVPVSPAYSALRPLQERTLRQASGPGCRLLSHAKHGCAYIPLALAPKNASW